MGKALQTCFVLWVYIEGKALPMIIVAILNDP